MATPGHLSGGSEALRRPCCGRDAERPGQGSPARPPRWRLLQPGLRVQGSLRQ